MDRPQRRSSPLSRHLARAFPGVRALHDVSLSLYPGQVTALIGENGAGKSTLVKILTGIYQPDAGEIRVDGKPVTFPTPHKPPSSSASPPSIRRRCCSTICRSPRTSSSATRRARRFGTDRLADDARQAREVLDAMHASAHRCRHAAAAISASPTSISSPSRAPCRSTPRSSSWTSRPRRSRTRRSRSSSVIVELLKRGRQGDPLHQPQVRRDLPHRRPLHRVPRRRDGRRGADRRRQPERRSSA